MTLYDFRLMPALDLIRKGNVHLLGLCNLTEGERALCDVFSDYCDELNKRIDYVVDNQRALGQTIDNLSAEKRNLEKKLGWLKIEIDAL